jgi:TolB-like protein/Tfp pilus assembly protein PilF
MASIIPGYEYDIFISYRQKDNKGDRWVSEFVDALKTELESTFKEEISVYFDINPHDGLLETHDVNASLKEKLKCLIFIPITSQTYCDPQSFAWQHEFCAFNKLAKEDQFGRDIKLAGGNIASRILPIKIHDLDIEDKALLENELGGVLRAIEFIYNSAGVNRPLNPSDNPDKNLNKTYYRDQINKVANSVKEIINAIKKYNQQDGEVHKEIVKAKPERLKNLKPKIIIISTIILALIVLGYFIIPKLSKSSKPVEKSIAVLPFINDSPDKENAYFINGIMDEIINNLQKISEFSRVLPRTSVEQFRGETRPSIPEIAKKLNVNYIVQGSGQKYGNKFVLRVQLIAAHNEKQLWGKPYEQEIHETSDMINIESQIAQSIAAEMKATITPEEKQRIEKTPTTNLTAYDFYQRGQEEFVKYTSSGDKKALERAKEKFKKALEYDSTFAQAYVGLSWVYLNSKYIKEYFSPNFMDSVLIFSNIALSYDNHLAEAYLARANYYVVNDKTEQAIKEFDKALKYNPNYCEAYHQEAIKVYEYDTKYADYVKAIEYMLKAISLNRGKELPGLLGELGDLFYDCAGFPEKGNYYYQEAFKLDGDSIKYYSNLDYLEYYLGHDLNKQIELEKKIYAIDTTAYVYFFGIAWSYMSLGKYKESLEYFKKYEERLVASGQLPLNRAHRIGYAYLKNGYKKEAEHWFSEQRRYCEESINKGRNYSIVDRSAYYDLAAVYAVLEEKGKAYENLRAFAQAPVCQSAILVMIKEDWLFDNIRNEPEFQRIVKELESKYQAEHERVRKWLEEQGKL